MILIATALRAEARSLIRLLGLSAVPDANPATYANDHVALVVTGVGRLRAAAAIGYCFGRFPHLTAVVNVGVAGCTTAKLGDLFIVNKLRDAATHRVHYPDMMTAFGIPEAALVTHDVVQTSADTAELVDMEGFALYDAAARYLPPHRIVVLKVVSDGADGITPDATAIESLMALASPAIVTALELVQSMPPDKRDPLRTHTELMKSLANAMRLTASQRVQLEEVVRDRLLNASSALPDLNEFLDEQVTTKHEGKRRFERLKRVLLDA